MPDPFFSVQVHNALKSNELISFEWGVELPPTVTTSDPLSFEPYIGPDGIKKYPIPFPLDDDHHTALGKFLDAWSRLEISIDALISQLFGVDYNKTKIVTGALGTRATVDILVSLTAVQLSAELAKVAEGLAERLKGLNTKRNRLVHGVWTLEAIVDVVKGEPRIRSRIYRMFVPGDPRIVQKLGDLRNQKARTSFMFSPKQLAGTTHNVNKLREDFADFLTRAFPNFAKGV